MESLEVPLTHADFLASKSCIKVLAYLRDQPGHQAPSVAAISRGSSIERTQTTKIVKRLQEAGLVVLAPDGARKFVRLRGWPLVIV